MTYFKVLLMWVGFIAITSIFGEYIVSREVHGAIQLISFIGLVGVFMYLSGETVNFLFKNKKQND